MSRRRLGLVPSATTKADSSIVSSAPSLLEGVLVAQKETEGTANVVATLGISTASVLLVSIDAVRTALFAGPPTLNNSNTFGSAIVNEVYSPDFGQYSLRAYKLANANGGSAHSSTLTKSSSTAEEATKVLLAFSAAADVIAQSAVVRNAAGAGATLTSASFTVAAGGRARCLAIWSGTGNVNATPPTATMVNSSNTTAAQWGSPIASVAYGSASAPNGHIPLTLWVADLLPGTYEWAAQPAINEGAIMATLVIR